MWPHVMGALSHNRQSWLPLSLIPTTQASIRWMPDPGLVQPWEQGFCAKSFDRRAHPSKVAPTYTIMKVLMPRFASLLIPIGRPEATDIRQFYTYRRRLGRLTGTPLTSTIFMHAPRSPPGTLHIIPRHSWFPQERQSGEGCTISQNAPGGAQSSRASSHLSLSSRGPVRLLSRCFVSPLIASSREFGS